MSTLRKPTIGPIVGHTTDTTCRLWIGASDPNDSKQEVASSRRTIGVIGVVTDGPQGKVVQAKSINYFRLKRSYDRTGSFNLGVDRGLPASSGRRSAPPVYSLQPDTHYTVRMAIMPIDDAFDDDFTLSDEELGKRLPDPRNWAEVLSDFDDAYVEAQFKTYPPSPENGPATEKISFLFGSCRYPGLLWKRKHADRIFGPMLELAEAALEGKPDPINFALMIGDQIYADLMNRHIPIGRADTYGEFQERYHTAFKSRYMSRLLRSLPTYMILDDHEIEDNWTQDRIGNSQKRILFNIAIGAYMSYQWSHSPRKWNNCCKPTGNLSALDRCLHNPSVPQLYYDFLCRGYPFFVLDTRTQRFKDDDPGLDDNHLLGRPSLDPSEPGQRERLLYWLAYQQRTRGNTPKFIVSSSVFVPNPVKTTKSDKEKDKSDSWPAYPKTRRTLLDLIVAFNEGNSNGIENVVFLCGDIHNFNIAQMDFQGGPNSPTAYSITSSGLYWPFPFADGAPSHYVHDSTDPETLDTFYLSDGNGAMNYRAWGFSQADNFSRVDIDAANHQLVVSVMDKNGKALATKKQNGAINSSAHRLQLAAW